MKQLAIWILGLIECLILLMMKFIKVLEGEINADSAAKSGKLIKIPGDIPVIKGTGPVNPSPTVTGYCVHTGALHSDWKEMYGVLGMTSFKKLRVIMVLLLSRISFRYLLYSRFASKSDYRSRFL